MKINTILLLFLCLCINQGCFLDMLNSDEKKVVGNISLINSHVHENNGFRLNYYTGQYNRGLINTYVSSLFGNDTLLLVKTKDTSGIRYFAVKHNKGNVPIEVLELDSLNKMIYYSIPLEHKYKFESN